MNQKIKSAVVITGASTGVGRETALLLDKQGYQVFAGVRTKKDAESLKLNASSNLLPIILDVTKSEQIKSAVELISLTIVDRGLIGLINNAGILVDGPLEYLSIEELRWQFEVNVIGQVAITQAFLPMIRQTKGRIINIGSVSGKVSSPFFVNLLLLCLERRKQLSLVQSKLLQFPKDVIPFSKNQLKPLMQT